VPWLAGLTFMGCGKDAALKTAEEAQFNPKLIHVEKGPPMGQGTCFTHDPSGLCFLGSWTKQLCRAGNCQPRA